MRCVLWYGGMLVFFFQAEDGIRDLVRSRGLGDVYKRQQGVPRDRRDGGHDLAIARERQKHITPSVGFVPDLSLIHI